jgi:hypothetical protein
MSKLEVASKLDQIIEFSGIEEFIDTPVKRYSSGMYARLGFSVAAHVNPDVLIVDEVLSVGDYLFQQRCLARMREVVAEGAAVLFVSHNLKSVTDFCHRCLQLERGKIIALGPTEDVIASYVGQGQADRSTTGGTKAVAISRVRIRNASGECLRFESGEQAWIDIEVTASERCSKLSISLYITDENFQSVFDTSTERLGHGNFDLEAGQVFCCTFELRMNFAGGVFHPSTLVYRYDTQTEFDHLAPAATVHVSSADDVRGIVHCFPRVVRQEIMEGRRRDDRLGEPVQVGPSAGVDCAE